ncbi:hypothetical protein P175DRAFT_0558553 [Aspergillus ochraceoroseus IBT 24754]|uniref:Fungal N-terminal domain-containing protein n=1 Tax=Aspergillus ochraceoroseus IBT 24754 TaxID=1392256 RepID=A0A2T5LVQ4_9EURO|nr:uncharacterized protein P175DRAFT_0558553 [Aspergillus ochraceoroseus IBT 24754]PTU20361.1 hypothetical protein P175DRAFT_0558553 [Aspergillus ochraceoroseus IBT 24754]
MALQASIASSASSLAATCTEIINTAHTIDLFQEDDNHLQDLLKETQILSATLSTIALFWTVNRLVAISNELSEILQILSISFHHCNLTLKQIQWIFKEENRDSLSSFNLWRKRIRVHADITALVLDAIVDPDFTGVKVTNMQQLLEDIKQIVEGDGKTVSPSNTQGLEMKDFFENGQILVDKVHQYTTSTRSEGGTVSDSPAEHGPSAPDTGRVLAFESVSATSENDRTLSENHAFSEIRELIYSKNLSAAEEYSRTFHTRVALTLESRRLGGRTLDFGVISTTL